MRKKAFFLLLLPWEKGGERKKAGSLCLPPPPYFPSLAAVSSLSSPVILRPKCRGRGRGSTRVTSEISRDPPRPTPLHIPEEAKATLPSPPQKKPNLERGGRRRRANLFPEKKRKEVLPSPAPSHLLCRRCTTTPGVR